MSALSIFEMDTTDVVQLYTISRVVYGAHEQQTQYTYINKYMYNKFTVLKLMCTTKRHRTL